MTSCSCLRVSKPDRPLKPGKSSVIRLSYSPSQEGKSVFSNTAIVKTDDPHLPQVILYATGSPASSNIHVRPTEFRLENVILGHRRSVSLGVAFSHPNMRLEKLQVRSTLKGTEVTWNPVNADTAQNRWLNGLREANCTNCAVKTAPGQVHFVPVKEQAGSFDELLQFYYGTDDEPLAVIALRGTFEDGVQSDASILDSGHMQSNKTSN